MEEINYKDKYKFKLSNGDYIIDSLENHLNLLKVNGLDVIGCLGSGRLVKLSIK